MKFIKLCAANRDLFLLLQWWCFMVLAQLLTWVSL